MRIFLPWLLHNKNQGSITFQWKILGNAITKFLAFRIAEEQEFSSYLEGRAIFWFQCSLQQGALSVCSLIIGAVAPSLAQLLLKIPKLSRKISFFWNVCVGKVYKNACLCFLLEKKCQPRMLFTGAIVLISFETDFPIPLVWGSIIRLRWMARDLQGFARLCLPRLQLQILRPQKLFPWIPGIKRRSSHMATSPSQKYFLSMLLSRPDVYCGLDGHS